MRVGVQQKFNQRLSGVVFDLNSFDASFLKYAPLYGSPFAQDDLP